MRRRKVAVMVHSGIPTTTCVMMAMGHSCLPATTSQSHNQSQLQPITIPTSNTSHVGWVCRWQNKIYKNRMKYIFVIIVTCQHSQPMRSLVAVFKSNSCISFRVCSWWNPSWAKGPTIRTSVYKFANYTAWGSGDWRKEPWPTARTRGLHSNTEFQPCKALIWPRFFVSNRRRYGHGRSTLLRPLRTRALRLDLCNCITLNDNYNLLL